MTCEVPTLPLMTCDVLMLPLMACDSLLHGMNHKWLQDWDLEETRKKQGRQVGKTRANISGNKGKNHYKLDKYLLEAW